MRKPVTVLLGLALVALAVAGCNDDSDEGRAAKPDQPSPSASTSKEVVTWPAPPDPLKRTVAAGLKPGVKEFLINHVHAYLEIYVDGLPVTVPAGIGINIKDPEVIKFAEADGSFSYGGIERCRRPCISPLHTHDATGELHTESATPEPNTLGEFFTEWGVRLDESCVAEYCNPEPIAIYVNGKPYTQDPRTITLTDHKEIKIAVGTPPSDFP